MTQVCGYQALPGRLPVREAPDHQRQVHPEQATALTDHCLHPGPVDQVTAGTYSGCHSFVFTSLLFVQTLCICRSILRCVEHAQVLACLSVKLYRLIRWNHSPSLDHGWNDHIATTVICEIHRPHSGYAAICIAHYWALMDVDVSRHKQTLCIRWLDIEHRPTATRHLQVHRFGNYVIEVLVAGTSHYLCLASVSLRC